jgi:hypothetical protein
VVACVLAPLSVVAIWTRNQVTNTNRYLATVTPLASDPAIQNAIADQITAQMFTYIDIKGLTTQAVDALAGRGLSPDVADQLQAFAIAVYVANDHRRALIGAGLGIAVGMVVLALGLTVFRAIYLDAVPAAVLPHDAAAVLHRRAEDFQSTGGGLLDLAALHP